VGHATGALNQGGETVAVGLVAGKSDQGFRSIAIGAYAGECQQAASSIAIGRVTGYISQGLDAIAIGRTAAYSNQGSGCIAIGFDAGRDNHGERSIAIGLEAGEFNQASRSIAIGRGAAQSTQSIYSVAIGDAAGQCNQSSRAIAIGLAAGQITQGCRSVAIGEGAATTSQSFNAVAIGFEAGDSGQGQDSVAIGQQSGFSNQGVQCVAVGDIAGQYNQGNNAVAVGYLAGRTYQSANSVAVGAEAARSYQSGGTVGVGGYAAYSNQGSYCVAIGWNAGYTNQKSYAVAIGRDAGKVTQGTDSIAIGLNAGETNQHDNTIVLNASGSVVNTNRTNAMFVRIIRNSGALSYSSGDYEVYGNSSDDRVKHNETYIKNALQTIMKLKPQTYDKAFDLDSNAYIEQHESGFMAQDIWYDIPEMRHIVILAPTADPTPEKPPAPSGDPADDPDYSAWGKELSTLHYHQVIPFLTKAVQEVAVEVPRAKTTVSNTWGQNITGLVVSADTNKHKTNTVPIVNLSNVSMDKSWYGVVSSEKTDSTDYDTLVDIKGDTRVWVTDVGGSLESGDFITTSNIAPGFTQKQSDDLVHNYTIGKITQDCDFTEPSNVTLKVPRQELSNVTYYIHQTQVRISEEDYNRIGMESKKTTGYDTMYRKNDNSEEINQNTYDSFDSSEQEEYEPFQKLIYYRLDRHETKFPRESHTITEVRQELVDVLDENGQIVWEDTANTVPVYTLVDHGTYKAALVSCKLI
jgi:hypothetical protein